MNNMTYNKVVSVNQTHRSSFLCRKTTHSCYLPVKFGTETKRNISTHDFSHTGLELGIGEEELQDKRINKHREEIV